jgi:magnesium chelatase family protein
MSKYVKSIIETGLQGLLVDIECHITNGLPAIIIVGFANRSIEEAKERLRGAFSSSGLILPRKRITLNLAPGDIPKDGTSFDLAMALAILMASQALATVDSNWLVIGELSLDGRVRPVRGIIGKLFAAQALGVTRCYIPAASLPQARLVPGLELVAVDSLQALYEHLIGLQPLVTQASGHALELPLPTNPQTDLRLIAGQSQAKRALELPVIKWPTGQR